MSEEQIIEGLYPHCKRVEQYQNHILEYLEFMSEDNSRFLKLRV